MWPVVKFKIAGGGLAILNWFRIKIFSEFLMDKIIFFYIIVRQEQLKQSILTKLPLKLITMITSCHMQLM